MAHTPDSDGTQHQNAYTKQSDSPIASRAAPEGRSTRPPSLQFDPSRNRLFKTTRRGSRVKQCGTGLTEAERTSMLAAVEDVIPIRRDEWERVLALDNEQWSRTGCSVEAMRRKFS